MIYESQYYGIVNTGPELMHHGIKGQRWGVRRFQYEDGSYTQAGLKRYRDAESKTNIAKAELKDAKRAYKDGRGSQVDVYKAKVKVESAKVDLKKANRQLKKDVKRDKGRELYARGKTIEINAQKRNTMRSAAGLAIAGSAYAFQKIGGADYVRDVLASKSIANSRPRDLAVTSVLAGSVAAAAILEGKYAIEDSRMRAYWHNRGKQG